MTNSDSINIERISNEILKNCMLLEIEKKTTYGAACAEYLSENVFTVGAAGAGELPEHIGF